MATKGYIDGVRNGSIFGWALDPERPGARIELEVQLDGEAIGGCLADLERDDLASKGIGDGRHGFRVGLPHVLDPDRPHQIIVRVKEDGTILPLAERYVGGVDNDSTGRPLVLTIEGPASDEEPPSAAVVGRDGWLFPNDGSATLARARAPFAFESEWLTGRVRRLRDRAELVARLGSVYLPVSLPPKAAVYTDLLPPSAGDVPIPDLGADGRPAAQLARALRDDPRLEFLDLLGPLRDARRHGPVFTRLGTGLTWVGAFHGSRAIVKELGKRLPDVAPLPLSWLTLGELVESEDSLDERQPLEVEPGLAAGTLRASEKAVDDVAAKLLSEKSWVLERDGAENEMRAVVLVEGAERRIALILAEHFAQTIVVPTAGAPAAAIAWAKPHAVIQVLVDGGAFLI
jgi:hypothetical protein